MRKKYFAAVIVLLAVGLTSCGTLFSQQYLSSHCSEEDGPLPNIYSGVIFDLRGAFHYRCMDNECKYLNYGGTNNIELFIMLDIPLSLALDTVILPVTVYKQSRYGDICAVQARGPGAKILIVSIDVAPLNVTLTRGATRQFTATGTFSDGSMKDISAQVAWSSSDPARVTIDASGVATAAEAGTVIISATRANIVGSGMIMVVQ